MHGQRQLSAAVRLKVPWGSDPENFADLILPFSLMPEYFFQFLPDPFSGCEESFQYSFELSDEEKDLFAEWHIPYCAATQ